MLRRPLAAAGLAALTFSHSIPALAHNKGVHQDLTDFAYEIMLAAQKTQNTGTCALPGPTAGTCAFDRPTDVDAASWSAFLATITAAVPKLQGLPAGLPPPHKNYCGDGSLPSLSSSWADGKALGGLSYAPGTDYIVGSDCGVMAGWAPPGVFAESNASPSRDYTGITLGFWASSIDDEFDDVHLEIKPFNALGVGAVKDKLSELWDAGLLVVFLPFVCLFDCLFGSCDSCAGDAADLAHGTNPIDNLEGLLPGFGDFSGGTYTGLWHFINMRPGASNEYDDRQGMLYDEAGPFGIPDPVEVLIMALADASGLTVNYSKSNGTKRYQISGANDLHPDTHPIRGQGEWEHTTLAHETFEPLDNLAFFGWKNFRGDAAHVAHNLAWPLHALGDATVPMHVTGTSGWGHRPFEDAQQHLWRQLIGLEAQAAALTATERRRQFLLVRGILRLAFDWRRMLQNKRKGLGGNEVAVRDLVTALAQTTHDYALSKFASTPLWPYFPTASTTYLVDEGSADGLYEDRTDAVSLGQPLMAQGVAATVAFLMSAMEVL